MLSKKMDSSGSPYFSKQADIASEACFLSYVPKYGICFFQLDDVLIERDIGCTQGVCYVKYNACILKNDKYYTSLHNF